MTGSAADLSTLRDRYLKAVLSPIASHAFEVIEDALKELHAPESIYLDVIAPTMVQIGELWAEAQISVAQEHVATALTSAAMARLSPQLAQSDAGAGVVVLACPAEELHQLGLRMVADFLEADGWLVRFVGAATPTPDLVKMARDERVQVVGLSTALTLHLDRTRELVYALQACRPRPFIVVGGNAYGGDERLAASIGADAFAADPSALRMILRGRIRR